MTEDEARIEANQDILREVFPVESELVGTENLRDISAGATDFSESPSGFRMEVTASVEVLANAVTIMAFVWTLARTRRGSGLPLSAEELDKIDKAVVASVEESSNIFGTKRRALYLSVLKRTDVED